MATRLLGVFVVSLIALSTAGIDENAASASHPYIKPYLWADLQPGGDGRIQYKMCGDGTPQEVFWDDGPENWEVKLVQSMQFDPVSCSAGTFNALLQWESPTVNQCGAFIACWDAIGEVDFGSYWRLTPGGAFVWFDKVQYVGLASDTWRAFVSGHEWGHVLNLDHHTTTGPCAQQSIMAYVIGPDPATCGLVVPSASDVGAVRCRSYGCHPNGTVVQASSGVFVIQNNIKRHVLSPPVQDLMV
jgi:hypothetical protein